MHICNSLNLRLELCQPMLPEAHWEHLPMQIYQQTDQGDSLKYGASDKQLQQQLLAQLELREDICSQPQLGEGSGTYTAFPIASGLKPICSSARPAHLPGYIFLQHKAASKLSEYSSTPYSDLDLDEQTTVLNLNFMVNPLSNLQIRFLNYIIFHLYIMRLHLEVLIPPTKPRESELLKTIINRRKKQHQLPKSIFSDKVPSFAYRKPCLRFMEAE